MVATSSATIAAPITATGGQVTRGGGGPSYVTAAAYCDGTLTSHIATVASTHGH
jgi:hypothetical protein